MYSSSTTTPVAAVWLRRARPDESGSLRGLVAAAFGQYRRVLPTALLERYLEDLRSVADDTDFTIVADRDGRIVGSVRFVPPPTPAEPASIRALSVHPLERGHGIGRRLVTAAERLARSLDATELRFHTARIMRSAVSLYERLGYRRAPEHDVDPAVLYPDLVVPPDLAIIAYQRDLRSTSTPRSTTNTNTIKENQK
jgi:GNAT superfamily N-acetyltransferase